MSDQKQADKTATKKAAKVDTEGQATTVAPPPVEDPKRKPYESTTNLGYRPGRAEVDVNAQPPEEDRKFSIASRARWGETSAAELRKERRKIDERIRKQSK